MLISIVKAILVIVIMIAMVLILLGINHFLHGNNSHLDEEVERMRRDVATRGDVMTEGNVFQEFIPGTEREDKGNLKETVSRVAD